MDLVTLFPYIFFVGLPYTSFPPKEGIFILFGNIFTVPLKTIPLRAPLSKLNIFKTTYAPKNIRYYSTSSNLSQKNSSDAHCEVPALTSAATEESSSLNPWFTTGFVDGEGSFILKVSKAPRYRTGWRVEAIFIIGIHQKDLPLLEEIKASLGDIGRITFKRGDMVHLTVSSINDLSVIS